MFSQTSVKASQSQNQKSAQDIRVISVAGKKTTGLIA
jgi:hypothetical protein